jgi:DNA segregation ATPase FtsK/SpoIIIE-like protein
VGIRHYLHRSPAVYRIRVTKAGEDLDVRIPVGASVRDLELATDVLAVALQVREVRVTPSTSNAARASVSLIRRDPLIAADHVWPSKQLVRGSLWEPVPIGVDESGDVVSISLVERNVLVGGEPGAGKSVALSQLVAAAALDPSVRLHLFDGKVVELAPWNRCADQCVGADTASAISVLNDLVAEMNGRYGDLLTRGLRAVRQDSGLQLHVVVIDELAFYLASPDRSDRVRFTELLRDLVARGRAAGFIVLAATQKPSHDVVPTSLRDLFGFRWAFRCNTPQASDTILGSGWAAAGFSAASIDAAYRGVSYLLHEGTRPVRLRTFNLRDSDVSEIAGRAAHLRVASGTPEKAP